MLFRKFPIAFSEISSVRDAFVSIFGNNIRTGRRHFFLSPISETLSVREICIPFVGNKLTWITLILKDILNHDCLVLPHFVNPRVQMSIDA